MSSLSIGFTGPGDFHLGFNSLIRGEGRWLSHMARVLSKNPAYEVAIIGQNNRIYEDDKYKIYYFNVDKMIESDLEFDILFSMDAFEDCGLEENWMSPKVSKIKAKRKVFAPFFGSTQHYNATIPVVYPYYYREVDNEHTFCLPICFGSKNDLTKNNFNEKNAIWFSKNSHENPEYLFNSLSCALLYIEKFEGKLIIVDGHKLMEEEGYKDAERVKKLLDRHAERTWWSREWIPYNKMTYALSKSRFITGIHHPVANPMQLDIVFQGGVPIIFENQKHLPPYDKIPDEGFFYIDFDKINYGSIYGLYGFLENPKTYNEQLEKCKVVAEQYSDEVFLERFETFITEVL